MDYGRDTEKLLSRIEQYCSEAYQQERDAGHVKGFTLDLNNLEVDSLPDLRGLPPIKILTCMNVPLKSLPPLPEMLEELYIGPSEITVLPELPATLRTLFVPNSPLVRLPTPLPPCLELLYCSATFITSLPPLPPTLERLYCGHIHMTHLPPLPPNLKELSIDHTQVSNLPPLPSSLLFLSCKSTKLPAIPKLPDGFLRLECDGNPQIKSLPRLPPLLNFLSCRNTNITDLPPIPSTLKTLLCCDAKIRSFPDLPPTLFHRNPMDRLGIFSNLDFDRYCHPSLYQGDDEALEDFFLRWSDWLSMDRVNFRTKLLAEDLIATTWHPDRFERWCLDEDEKRENIALFA